MQLLQMKGVREKAVGLASAKNKANFRPYPDPEIGVPEEKANRAKQSQFARPDRQGALADEGRSETKPISAWQADPRDLVSATVCRPHLHALGAAGIRWQPTRLS